MINRLVRAFESLSNVELDGKDRGGMQGEDFAEAVIDDGQNGCYIRNPILPHPRKQGFYLETDFLVYIRDTLFCVEIKNYRGKVYYPARYRTTTVQKGWFIFKRNVPQTVFDHYDHTKMVQEKMGQNGEGLVTREMPNPLLKTQEYSESLKHYLTRIDPRLGRIPIYSALGFARKTDITAIANFDAGIMYISQLPEFFEKHSNPRASKTPAPWIRQALHKLPTWDRILTREQEWINGTFVEQTFSFKDTDGRQHTIPFAKINKVNLKRDGSRLSAYDTMLITFTNGDTQTFKSTGGEIHLNRFKGEVQTHKLRNVDGLVVGIANR